MIDKKADAIRRGQEAQARLDDPLWQEFVKDYESAIIDNWKQANTVEQREECWRMLDLITKAQAFFISMAASGRLTEKLTRNV